MRVTHVLWTGEIGGIERLVHDLALAQRELGLDVRVAFGRARGPFAERLRDAGIPVVDLGVRSGYDLRPHALRRARRLLADADVLHIHAWNLPLGLAMLGRPLVYTEHGTLGLHRRQTPLVRAKRALHRAAVARAAVVTTISSFLAQRFAQTLHVPPSRIRIVPNGVAEPGGEVRERPGDELVVAVVGRLAAVKRVDRVLDALSHVPPEVPVRLVVAGAGPLEAELRARATERVEFVGAVDDVLALLASVDVMVLATTGEPFGLVILEAASVGALPIVFADAGGAIEILPPDGIVVGDERELAAVLAQLPGSPALSGDARRERAAWTRRTFPIARTAAQFRDLYAEAVAAQPKPSLGSS